MKTEFETVRRQIGKAIAMLDVFQGSITHPPDHLSMSSLSGSLVTDKDLSEALAYLTTPSNSISLSTTSNRSMNIKGEKNPRTNRKHSSIDQSSSKKTFTRSRNTHKPQSTSKFATKRITVTLFLSKGTTRKTTSSSLPLLDAYRFRDTIRLHSTHLSPARAKLR
jgi:hypothetical protein